MNNTLFQSLTYSERKVYEAVWWKSDVRACTATNATLRNVTNLPVRTLEDALHELRKLGLTQHKTFPPMKKPDGSYYRLRTIYLVNRNTREDLALIVANVCRERGQRVRISDQELCGQARCTPEQLQEALSDAVQCGWLAVETDPHGRVITRIGRFPKSDLPRWMPGGPFGKEVISTDLEREQALLVWVKRTLELDRQFTASNEIIAMRLQWSERWVRGVLKNLYERGVLHRKVINMVRYIDMKPLGTEIISKPKTKVEAMLRPELEKGVLRATVDELAKWTKCSRRWINKRLAQMEVATLLVVRRDQEGLILSLPTADPDAVPEYILAGGVVVPTSRKIREQAFGPEMVAWLDQFDFGGAQKAVAARLEAEGYDRMRPVWRLSLEMLAAECKGSPGAGPDCRVQFENRLYKEMKPVLEGELNLARLLPLHELIKQNVIHLFLGMQERHGAPLPAAMGMQYFEAMIRPRFDAALKFVVLPTTLVEKAEVAMSIARDLLGFFHPEFQSAA